jgi:hypothetical protein
MSLRKNKREIERLIDAFESEAAKFHDITFTTYTIRQESPLYNPKFRSPQACWLSPHPLPTDVMVMEETKAALRSNSA